MDDIISVLYIIYQHGDNRLTSLVSDKHSLLEFLLNQSLFCMMTVNSFDHDVFVK